MPKVLVVDDSGTMRKIVMKGVKLAGFDVEFIEAGDGVEALEALGKHPDIELVLSDVNMPNMDGIELVRCIRDQTAMESSKVGDKELIKKVSNTIPIIMVTTEGGLDKVNEALAAGANEYLKKPFTPDQLAEKIGGFLS